MMIISRLAITFIFVFMLFGFNTLADTIKLDENGVLHKIEVVHLEGSTEKNPKTYLLHTLQKEDGTIEERIIPGTEDLLPDLEPQIEINPSTQHPFITWSRFDETDYEIILARFDHAHWSTSRPITMNSSDDREPRIIIGLSGLTHLMWKEETLDIPNYYYLILNSTQGMSAAIPNGPDLLIPPDNDYVLPDGTTPSCSAMPEDQDFFFAFQVSIPPNRIVVWGGRDDPSPISFEEAFKLPEANIKLSSLKAQIVNGKLTVIFRSDNNLYYTYRTIQGWTPYRVIKLDDTLSEGKAELLIKEMLGGL